MVDTFFSPLTTENPQFDFTDILIGIVFLTIIAVVIGNYRHRSWIRSSTPSMSNSSYPPRRIVFIFAHPDDEAMFFVPTITSFSSSSSSSLPATSTTVHDEIYWLCLSNGNFDGLGEKRTKELYASGKVLGIPENRITIINHHQLQDGTVWESTVVKTTVEEYIQQKHINLIITFDKYGISGHKNHISVWQGITQYLAQQQQRIDCYTLTTVSVFRKFLGVFDLPYSILEHYYLRSHVSSSSIVSNPVLIYGGWNSLRLSHKAMQAHASQYVWFRRLFVGFSRYALINSLQLVTINNNSSNNK